MLTRETDITPEVTIDKRVEAQNELHDFEFTVDDISRLLTDLNPAKSPGPDKVHPKLLKSCPSLAWPLFILFRQSIDLGKLPTDWKNSSISPIFKKGQRNQPCNYRPAA